MGKHSKVPPSTIWRLGENVVLRLGRCLTASVSFDIFMDNYLTSFRLLTHLEINNIRATRVLNKNRLTNSCKKRNMATLNNAYQAKKQCNFNTGWLERQQGDLHSFF